MEDLYAAWKGQIFEARTWSKVRGPAGAVHRDLGTYRLSGLGVTHLTTEEVKINCRHVCRSDVKKQVIKYVEEGSWRQWKRIPKTIPDEGLVRTSRSLHKKESARRCGPARMRPVPDRGWHVQAGFSPGDDAPSRKFRSSSQRRWHVQGWVSRLLQGWFCCSSCLLTAVASARLDFTGDR